MDAIIGLIPWLIDLVTGRQRVSVLVHRAVFVAAGRAASPVQLFIKVTNLSTKRDVEITHVWFATAPKVHVFNADRPLPKRLRPDETWETWIDASAVPDTPKVEDLCRVRLSRGKTAKSRLNRDVPEFGQVAGLDPPTIAVLPDAAPQPAAPEPAAETFPISVEPVIEGLRLYLKVTNESDENLILVAEIMDTVGLDRELATPWPTRWRNGSHGGDVREVAPGWPQLLLVADGDGMGNSTVIRGTAPLEMGRWVFHTPGEAIIACTDLPQGTRNIYEPNVDLRIRIGRFAAMGWVDVTLRIGFDNRREPTSGNLAIRAKSWGWPTNPDNTTARPGG